MSDQSVQNSLYFPNISSQYLEQQQTMHTDQAFNINDEAVIINLFFQLVLKPNVSSLEQIVQIINIVFDIPMIKEHSQFMKSLRTRILQDIQKQEQLLRKISSEHRQHLKQIQFQDLIKDTWTHDDMLRRVKKVKLCDIIEQKQQITKKLLKCNEDLLHQYKSLQSKIGQIKDHKFNPNARELHSNKSMQGQGNNAIEQSMKPISNNNKNSSKNSSKEKIKFIQNAMTLQSVRTNPYELEIKQDTQKNKRSLRRSQSHRQSLPNQLKTSPTVSKQLSNRFKEFMEDK